MAGIVVAPYRASPVIASPLKEPPALSFVDLLVPAAQGALAVPLGEFGLVAFGSKTFSTYALTLGVETVSPVNGAVLLDVTRANTFIVSVTQTITSFALSGFPSGPKSERVTVYFRQDGAGFAIGGWGQIKWQGGNAPVLSTIPNVTDCLVFDSPDGGVTILGNLVGLAYA